jgi:DNA-binding transcriptional regulator GbsR (MarR family)
VLGRSGVEIVGRDHPGSRAGKTKTKTKAGDLIQATLCRRPSTLEDLVRTTGLSVGEVAKILHLLEEKGTITFQKGTRGDFYSICQKNTLNGNT